LSSCVTDVAGLLVRKILTVVLRWQSQQSNAT